MSPNEIQRKHLNEREAVVDDALYSSVNHLNRARNNFSAAIQDRQLRDEFTEAVEQAQQVIARLGFEF
ncbi:MAG TPA: hypothetical protein ENI11_02275 [Actinobacteria bacterium]|nr:hypothetical protein [Actinomycetota bacterium]